MNEIEDTTDSAHRMAMLAEAMITGGTSDSILRQEARGQQQLVSSTLLPVNTHGHDADFEALGFVFEPADSKDPLFRPTTLPEGWTKQATEHAMWSHVVDHAGRVRVEVFYKAAFYDRRAFMRIAHVQSYAYQCVLSNRAPIIDDSWATLEALRKALGEIESSERRYADDGTITDQNFRSECRTRADRARAMISRLS